MEVNQVYMYMPTQVCPNKVLSDHSVAGRVDCDTLALNKIQWCLTTSVSFVDYSVTVINGMFNQRTLHTVAVVYVQSMYFIYSCCIICYSL
jgi:hypothetical protein